MVKVRDSAPVGALRRKRRGTAGAAWMMSVAVALACLFAVSCGAARSTQPEIDGQREAIDRAGVQRDEARADLHPPIDGPDVALKFEEGPIYGTGGFTAIPGDAAEIVGRLIDTDGRPIAGMRVHIADSMSSDFAFDLSIGPCFAAGFAVTNASGRFSVQLHSPRARETFNIVAAEASRGLLFDCSTIACSGIRSDIGTRVVRGEWTAHMKVVDAHGQPLAGVPIATYRIEGSQEKFLYMNMRGTTNEDGELTASGLRWLRDIDGPMRGDEAYWGFGGVAVLPSHDTFLAVEMEGDKEARHVDVTFQIPEPHWISGELRGLDPSVRYAVTPASSRASWIPMVTHQYPNSHQLLQPWTEAIETESRFRIPVYRASTDGHHYFRANLAVCIAETDGSWRPVWRIPYTPRSDGEIELGMIELPRAVTFEVPEAVLSGGDDWVRFSATQDGVDGRLAYWEQRLPMPGDETKMATTIDPEIPINGDAVLRIEVRGFAPAEERLVFSGTNRVSDLGRLPLTPIHQGTIHFVSSVDGAPVPNIRLWIERTRGAAEHVAIGWLTSDANGAMHIEGHWTESPTVSVPTDWRWDETADAQLETLFQIDREPGAIDCEVTLDPSSLQKVSFGVAKLVDEARRPLSNHLIAASTSVGYMTAATDSNGTVRIPTQVITDQDYPEIYRHGDRYGMEQVGVARTGPDTITITARETAPLIVQFVSDGAPIPSEFECEELAVEIDADGMAYIWAPLGRFELDVAERHFTFGHPGPYEALVVYLAE